MKVNEFQKLIYDFAADNTRSMPWRDNTDPYYVLVSEIMLQQTQVDRVVPKFHQFINEFPNIETLAQAKLSGVLKVWSGLGYSRRAKFLWQSAQKIVSEYDSNIPSTISELVELPGVGQNTAGAIMTYVYNQPVVFIETNIRTVYLHHFFADQDNISDTQLREKVELTMDTENPRQWYWALMDYGTYLKKNGTTHLTRSKHYRKQTSFNGSVRQVRGQILRSLAESSKTENRLRNDVEADVRFEPALRGLVIEGFIQKTKQTYSLT